MLPILQTAAPGKPCLPLILLDAVLTFWPWPLAHVLATDWTDQNALLSHPTLESPLF
ncbi:uncharacterized protein LY79DRAFT_551426 [Colletotrichum navitas]|uniref:Uncharacterized protein n=1 Tax=Colletotrichum navitas TaxID=681940 RepID=A0AAD8Q127_9PEZI|nr:uncharacterized protein LY79DRAFT_551426 [Colletotrichum navitas]KAK1593623.1 hypothetical protein LY79DRAFT_551426 [Colletotrichum navitas]